MWRLYFKNYYTNWKIGKKKLRFLSNIHNISEIITKNSIEDWFSEDIEGICKYLKQENIPSLQELEGKSGIDKIENLFLHNSHIYQKGYNTSEIIKYLNFNILYDSLKNTFNILFDCIVKGEITI